MLVEPIPQLYEECRGLRRGSVVVNCALVAPDFEEESVTMTYSDLRSLIKDSEPLMQQCAQSEAVDGYEVRSVPARTLEEVLQEAGIDQLDFVSLDLEGLEAPALRGLDLDRRRPLFMLVETAAGGGRAAVEEVLGERYEALENLTPDDVLYRRRLAPGGSADRRRQALGGEGLKEHLPPLAAEVAHVAHVDRAQELRAAVVADALPRVATEMPYSCSTSTPATA